MKTKDLVPAQDFCMHHDIELAFIHSLHRSGLVDVTYIEEKAFIPSSQLGLLEKFVRLHYEMDINLEGIEAINYLLQRIEAMHDEIADLNERLKFYETTSNG